VGSSPSFTVGATTTSGLTNYQWFFNSSTVAANLGGTNKTLTITNVQAAGFGPYYVTVSDGYNPAVTSLVANLTVAMNPTLTTVAGAGTVQIGIPTELGPSYVLQYKTNLASTNAWTTLSTSAGTGNVITVTNNSTNSEIFYRVKMQ
jgi:hypothetical protein